MDDKIGDGIRDLFNLDKKIEGLKEVPEEKRLEKAVDLNIFYLIAQRDSDEHMQYMKKLASLGIKFIDIHREIIESSRELFTKDKTAFAISKGRDFAKGLGENALDRVAGTVHRLGVVNESRLIKLCYLTLTSRLLDKPVNLKVDGASSGGKNFVITNVLKLFPESAYIYRTSLSPKALAYSDEDFKHRTIVIAEKEGFVSADSEYFLRTLLSEGKIIHETVEASGGLKTKLLTKQGPTNCIFTTTRIRINPENETRLLSFPINESIEQTRNIMVGSAQVSESVRLDKWKALQEWIASEKAKVLVPYAESLADKIPPVDIRLRRDFNTLLSLIKAHALLSQMGREEVDGVRIATIGDYAVVRELVYDIFSYQVGKGVKPIIRETVKAVERILVDGKKEHTTNAEVESVLGIRRDATSKRINDCINMGYLRDLTVEETNKSGKGVKKILVLGNPMPDDTIILPDPETLEDKYENN